MTTPARHEIFLDAPLVGEKEKEWLSRAIDTGYVSTVGPFVQDFARLCARRLGVDHVVAVQSGTTALTAALRQAGIGPGDEVIVPDLTFAATVNPVLYNGAAPVLVDVDRHSWQLSAENVREVLSPRTKAMIPVHLYGNPCAMDELTALAAEEDLMIIEDATEALGSCYKGKACGTFGAFGCFSFNGNKVMTTGGGGLITAAEPEALDHIAYLINQAKGFDRPDHETIGYNERMTNLEAALGLAQLEQLDAFLEQRRRFFSIYREALAPVSEICLQTVVPGGEPNHWMTAVRFHPDVDVTGLVADLAADGIPLRRVFTPLHLLGPYQQYAAGPCPHAEAIHEQSLCLPSSVRNSEDDIVRVCVQLKEALVCHSKRTGVRVP